jgi:hypothetical protein
VKSGLPAVKFGGLRRWDSQRDKRRSHPTINDVLIFQAKGLIYEVRIHK